MNKLARHDLEDTPDACIISHQFSMTAFSGFGGIDCHGNWGWPVERMNSGG